MCTDPANMQEKPAKQSAIQIAAPLLPRDAIHPETA
jgi:hypothetical protein